MRTLIFGMELFLAGLKDFHETSVDEFEVLLWFTFNLILVQV